MKVSRRTGAAMKNLRHKFDAQAARPLEPKSPMAVHIFPQGTATGPIKAVSPELRQLIDAAVAKMRGAT